MQRWLLLLLVLGLTACSKPEEDAPTPRKTRQPVDVVIDTSMGKITVQLDPENAPITVRNFLNYVEDNHYAGTVFHRVIPDFMIQGGGFLPGLKQKDSKYPPIRLETGLSNKRGTIAMARTNNPDSATDQFFINVKDNPALDPSPRSPGYAVFGKVIDGMDVVDRIRKVETGSKPDPRLPIQSHDDVPVKDVMILSITKK